MFLILLIVILYLVYYLIKILLPYPRYLRLAYYKPMMCNLYSWSVRNQVPPDVTTPLAKLLEFTIEVYCPKKLRKSLHEIFYKARSLVPYHQPLVWAFKKTQTGEFYWEIYYYGLSVSDQTYKSNEYKSLKTTPNIFVKKMTHDTINLPQDPFIVSLDISIKNNEVVVNNPVSYHATDIKSKEIYQLPMKVTSINLKESTKRSNFWIIYNQNSQLIESAKDMGMPEKLIPKVFNKIRDFKEFKSMTFAWKKEKKLISIYPCGININDFEIFLNKNQFDINLINLFKQYKKRFIAHDWDIVLNYNSENMKLVRTGFAGSL